jgi:hypothetical protein
LTGTFYEEKGQLKQINEQLKPTKQSSQLLAPGGITCRSALLNNDSILEPLE